jgi:hypothetical protein
VEQLLRSMATSLATFGTWRRSPSRLSAVRTTSDLRRWGSRLGESNSGPTHYECVALPTELRRPASSGAPRRGNPPSLPAPTCAYAPPTTDPVSPVDTPARTPGARPPARTR